MKREHTFFYIINKPVTILSMMNQNKLQECDEDSVIYCTKCYSLKIKYEESIDMDCCADCGCTDFKTTSFDDWEKLYKSRYGHKFVEEVGSIRNSPIFKMSNDQLKSMVYESPAWREICQALYPTFPKWLSKSDSVIMLFAKLYQDSRLDDLRMELINRSKK